ncbi:BTAD domain-containing putative transcriptional regulator [Catenuloplanes japonicus]|uniref:BTAD domain-containing putative transcriptional regulator n=1 Tax=Catenuloplanes japonicus TaxID=33876 RepID=UPI0005247993|nr:BTAD domain-containing putative transcriptional regulator [Catenuloplanes japonicus]
MLNVSVLGPVRAWLAGRELPLGATRQRTLFATLAAARGRPVSRERLITAVWGTRPPATAAGSVHTYVSGLRGALAPHGRELLRTADTGYALAVDDLDSARFTAAHAAALTLRGIDPAGAAADLGAALALWHGEPYAGLPGDHLALERTRLLTARLAARELRARLLLDAGDDGLIAELGTLIHHHPLHEPFHELRVRALLRAGRRAEAADAFEAARETLASELGVAPGPALRALEPSVVAHPGDRLRCGTVRAAASLGERFDAAELAAVTGRSAADLAGELEEALESGTLVASGSTLTFRDAAVRRSIAAAVPHADRLRYARALIRAGAAPELVAAQVRGVPEPDAFLTGWLAAEHAALVRRVPSPAAALFRAALRAPHPDAGQRRTLSAALVRAEFRAGRNPTAATAAVLETVTDPAARGEMWSLLAEMRFRSGDHAGAIALVESSWRDPSVPPFWRARHRAQLDTFRRGDLRALVEAASAEVVGHPVTETGVVRDGRVEDRVAQLRTRWMVETVRGRHRAALVCVDAALRMVRERTDTYPLAVDLFDLRVVTLIGLGELDAAERTVRDAARFGFRRRLPVNRVSAAVLGYRSGRWDDAAAELSAADDAAISAMFLGRREPGAVEVLVRGLTGLITVRREDRDPGPAWWDTGGQVTAEERENSVFLLLARAHLAERAGDAGAAAEILAPLLELGHSSPAPVRPWLPHLVRLAGDTGRAELAARAAHDAGPHGHGLITGDPRPLLAVAAGHRRSGLLPEEAATREDAAVLLAAADDRAGAAREADTAREIYLRLGAAWDLRRLERRMSASAR